MMASTETQAPNRAAVCRDCDAALTAEPSPLFCPHCGQATTLHPLTFFEFAYEFVTRYVATDGTLWRTLGVLIPRPGQLTCEYLAGRRRGYLPPLRLYLTASFLFFVIVKLFGANLDVRMADEVVLDPPDHATVARFQACVDTPGRCDTVEAWLAKFNLRLLSGGKNPRGLASRLVRNALYAMFMMLPIFAALMQLAYRRRRQSYGVHFVFGLHMHAFWFLALLAQTPLPEPLGAMMVLAVIFHGVLAMRRVHEGRWSATLARALFVSASYSVLLLLGTIVLLVAALWQAG